MSWNGSLIIFLPVGSAMTCPVEGSRVPRLWEFLFFYLQIAWYTRNVLTGWVTKNVRATKAECETRLTISSRPYTLSLLDIIKMSEHKSWWLPHIKTERQQTLCRRVLPSFIFTFPVPSKASNKPQEHGNCLWNKITYEPPTLTWLTTFRWEQHDGPSPGMALVKHERGRGLYRTRY